MVFKQDIGIVMGIDPAMPWDLSLYFFGSEYTKQLIVNGSSKANKYHGVSRFTDNFCAINDEIEFLTSFKNISPKELELKAEHQGNHASFLIANLKIQDSVFVHKLFDKRNKFPFFAWCEYPIC